MRPSVLMTFIYWLMVSELHAADKPSEYIKKLYDIDMPAEVNAKDSVTLLNDHTVICILSERAITNLVANRLLGYSEWRKVTPEESYGNRDVVVDGFVEKSLFEAHRAVKGFHQQMIIDKSKRKVVLINS